MWVVHSHILAGYDYVNDRAFGTKDRKFTDNDGHGTAVTGILQAMTDNEIGIAGLLSAADLIPLRVNPDKKLTDASSEQVARAITDAVDIYKADVITTSLEVKDTQALRDAIDHAAQNNVLVLGAAGNSSTADSDGIDPYVYPASYDSVISVGAVDSNRKVRTNSQKNDQVFVTAPGEGIVLLAVGKGSICTISSGTSYASPVVAALAAAAKQEKADVTVDQFKELLRESVTDAGKKGYDSSYGHGIVDFARFVNALKNGYAFMEKSEVAAAAESEKDAKEQALEDAQAARKAEEDAKKAQEEAEAARQAQEEAAKAAQQAAQAAEEAAQKAQEEADAATADAKEKAAAAEEAVKARQAAEEAARQAEEKAEEDSELAEEAAKAREEAEKAAATAQETAEAASQAAAVAEEKAAAAQKAMEEALTAKEKAGLEAEEAQKALQEAQARAEEAEKAKEKAQADAEEARKALDQKNKKDAEKKSKKKIKKPAKVKIKSVKAAKKALKLRWKKQAGVSGYQIQIAQNKKFTKKLRTINVKKAKKVSKKISGLRKKKTYYVRIRSYKKVDGQKIYGKWSKVKHKKTR